MSRVIVKISFSNPNLKKSRPFNMAHLKYIGTRPGVDKTVTMADLQKELSGKVESESEEYVKYISERPRSHGLFDANGTADLDETIKELSQNKGFVWRAIISLREADALNLGYDNKEKWQMLLRKQMPEMAYKMGIKLDNLRWVSAVHMEKGHPHAHVMIWENKPEAIYGKISNKAVESIRKQYIDEIFQDEKMFYLSEKNAMRDLIRDLAHGDMGEIARLSKEVRETGDELRLLAVDEIKPGLSPRLYPEIEAELFDRINTLANILPGHGRANLKFMPENVKEEVRLFANYVLNLDQYKPYVARYLKAVENNNRLYTSEEAKIKETLDKAYGDLRDRVSQVILRAAVESTIEEKYKVNQALVNEAAEIIKSQINITRLDNVEDKIISNVITTLHLSGMADNEIKAYLNDWNTKSGSMISQEKLDQVVEATLKKVSNGELYGKTPFISYRDWHEMFKALGVNEPPRWIYLQSSGRNFNSLISTTYDLWKALFNTIESKRMSEELLANHRKKAIAKSAALESKAARKEVAQKLQSPGLVKDDAFEK